MPKCMKPKCPNQAITMSSYCGNHQPDDGGPVYKLTDRGFLRWDRQVGAADEPLGMPDFDIKKDTPL